MHPEQKWTFGNRRSCADFALFLAPNAALSKAGRYLLFQSQPAVTNQRAEIGNQGIARFINPANVGTVHAPATF
jgi:hypothetical protein